MGFTLRIENAPPEAVLWNANFAEHAFDYDPIADSGWLGIGEVWTFYQDPLSCTTLRIWILDAEDNILLDVYNLGPIEDSKSYIYDCSTGELYEGVPEVALWPLALLGGLGVLGVVGIGAAVALAAGRKE